MVGIIRKAKFTTPGSSPFSSYVEYIDRDKAVFKKGLSSFNLFNDYMGNPEKSTGLFSSHGLLSDKEKKEMKEVFQEA